MDDSLDIGTDSFLDDSSFGDTSMYGGSSSPSYGSSSYGGIPVNIPPPSAPTDIGTALRVSAPGPSTGLGGSSMGVPLGIFPDSVDSSSSPDGIGSSGFLSGLGDLFAGIGSGVGAGIAGSNVPKVPTAGSGWQWNAATGTYYNPVTGQTMTATGTVPSLGTLGAGITGNSGLLIIGAIVIGAMFLFRRS
jgi:hypothetical protein